MARKRIFFVPTMDIEPLSIPGSGGPPNWDYAATSVSDFDSTCNHFGQRVTYFVHPEALLEPSQITLLKRLVEKGAELGLHLHPLKWSMFQFDGQKYFKDFGNLTAQETRELLADHIKIFKNAFGYEPRWFSPGMFWFRWLCFPHLTLAQAPSHLTTSSSAFLQNWGSTVAAALCRAG
jgi:hypothetical protein